MPHLEFAGAQLYYETEGPVSAPALLLFHAGIATLRMWDPLVPTLALDHYVIRFDLRGYGETETDNVEFSNRDDALAILDHLGIASATLIGCSRGGAIAIDIAVEHPDRVTGLVTIGSGPSGFPELELTTEEDALFDRMDALFEAGEWQALYDLEVRLWSIGPLRDESELDPEFVAEAYALNRANLPHVADAPIPIPLDPPAYDRVVDLDLPTLITVGAHDVSAAIAQFEYLAATIPRADSCLFPDSAHLPSVEQPDDFGRVLGDWLAVNEL
jgi:3-oxoadipate enol-lactonase